MDNPTHPYDLFMDATDGYLVAARNAIRRARGSLPVVRVVRVAAPEAEVIGKALVPAHTCGPQCDDAGCEITDGELEKAYNELIHRLASVKFLMGGQLPDLDRASEPTYAQLVEQYRAGEQARNESDEPANN